MTTDVTDYIAAMAQPWQVELATTLREMVFRVIPDATERIQYKQPHFLKNGKYAAVITGAKAHVSFTIFNTEGLEKPEGFEGPPQRAVLKVKEGNPVDVAQLEALLTEASATL